MRKRLISLLLAVAAVLSLAAPAFAAEGPEAFTESYAGEPQAVTGETGGSSEEETAAPEDTLLPEGEETPAEDETVPEETEETPAPTEQAPAETEQAPAETESAPQAPQAAPASNDDYGIMLADVDLKDTLKTNLTTAISDAGSTETAVKGSDKDKYTQESIDAFLAVLAEAKDMQTALTKENTIEWAEIGKMIDALNAAKKERTAPAGTLEEETAGLDQYARQEEDLDPLNELFEQAKNYKAETGYETKYLTSARTTLESAITAADTALNKKPYPLFKEVNEAIKRVTTAIEGMSGLNEVTSALLKAGYYATGEQADDALTKLNGGTSISSCGANEMYVLIKKPTQEKDEHKYYLKAVSGDNVFEQEVTGLTSAKDTGLVVHWTPTQMNSLEVEDGTEVTCTLYSFTGDSYKAGSTKLEQVGEPITFRFDKSYEGPKIAKGGWSLKDAEPETSNNVMYIELDTDKNITSESVKNLCIKLVDPAGDEYVVKSKITSETKFNWTWDESKNSCISMKEQAPECELTPGDYTVVLYANINSASGDDTSSLKQVDSLTIQVPAVDTTKLEKALDKLDEYPDLTTDWVKAADAKTAQSKAEDAQKLLDAAPSTPKTKEDQEKADQAASALTTELEKLKPKADYTELDAVIAQAEAIVGDGVGSYGASAFNEVSTKLQAARAVSRDLNTGEQTQIDNAKKALEDAIAGLSGADVEWKGFDETLQKAQAKTTDGKTYTAATMKVLQDAIKTATQFKKANEGKLKGTQQSLITEQVKKLNAAMDGLKEKADTTALEKAIKDAEAKLSSGIYTTATQAAVNKALETARGLLDADKDMQEKVTEAVTALNKAVQALVGVPVATGGEWVKSGNRWFYKADGKIVKGWVKDKGLRYYTDASGVMVTGWKLIDSHWYYFKPGTDNGQMLTGWQYVGGKWYYMNPADGIMVESGWFNLGGLWYYLKPGDGQMIEGWMKLGSNWYYLKPKDGRLMSGWQYIGGEWYYLSTSNGIMLTGRQTIGGREYYFKPGDGRMLGGWQKIEGNWYYYKPGKNNGWKLTGWQYIANRWYYLDPTSGAMWEGRQVIGGREYYLKPGDGRMLTGWQSISGNWYYYKTGRNNGWKLTGWQSIGGKWYYLDPTTGAMQDGWLQQGSIWYYLIPNNGQMVTGWQKISGSWYYFNNNGVMLANTTVDGHKLDGSGKRVS